MPCVKCGEDRSIILIGTNGSFCQQCFEKYFAHKFRASLGKNPVVRHGDRVTVAFSGGNNSSALLHIMLESLSPLAFKRLKFHPGVFFIDETSILPHDANYTAQLDEVRTILETTGLPCEIIKLEEVFKLSQDVDVSSLETDLSSQMKEFFESVQTLTSKQELLYRLRCKLLAYKAKELGYKHVFLGETSTRLAVNILSNLAQGRGAHLSLDTGFTDHGRYYGINLLRPMRDISAKEVAVYNKLNEVSTVFFPTFSTKQPANSSIQRLTEDFVVSLSADFPATETTVFRTSNKLEMSKSSKVGKVETTPEQETCNLCHAPLDNIRQNAAASALHALDFTEKLCAKDFGTPDNPILPKLEISDVPNTGLNRNHHALCQCCKILNKDIPDELRMSNVFAKELLSEKKLSDEEIRIKLDGVLLDS